MAASGFTPISLYYSATAAAVPLAANLTAGELSLNTADGKLYYKNSSNVVTLLASTAGSSGDVVGPASATDNALARFDLTTGKLIQNSVGILSDAGVLTGLTGLTSSGAITLSSLTSGRVTYAGASGLLTDSANMTFDGTSLSVAGLKSSGNALIGTTTDFSTTTVAGGLAVAGYGIYPYVSQGTTNSTIFSGINWYTPTAWSGNNGASSQTFYPVNVIANVKNDGSGGTNRTAIFALNLTANVESSGVASTTRSQAFLINSSRYSATDLSTRTDNQVFGGSITATHATTAPSTIVSSTLQAFGTTASNFSGTATLQIGMGSNIRIGDTAGAPTTVSTTAFNIYSSLFGVGTASGNTATVTTGASFYAVGPSISATGTMTTFYGLFLGAASISGTLTNNWGVYSEDTAAKNYFGGITGVGTTTPTSLLQTAGTSAKSAFKTPNIAEVDTISATAATGTINYDVTTQSVLYYTSNASGNFTVNFRGSSGTSLNTMMQTGESISATFLVTNGSTAYYNSAVTIDGTSVTPKWQGGSAPTSGNASSTDCYTYVLQKTGSATYVVLASQTKFA
jgi:hypothetical protein